MVWNYIAEMLLEFKDYVNYVDTRQEAIESREHGAVTLQLLTSGFSPNPRLKGHFMNKV